MLLKSDKAKIKIYFYYKSLCYFNIQMFKAHLYFSYNYVYIV